MPARYGQSVTPATGASATVTLTSARWRDATTTRLVDPMCPGATRTRPPAASAPTNRARRGGAAHASVDLAQHSRVCPQGHEIGSIPAGRREPETAATDQRGKLVGRQRESGEQPDEIGLAQPLTAPPLRGPGRCREQEEERGGTRDRHHYGRAHPDCSNLRSTESTPAYSA